MSFSFRPGLEQVAAYTPGKPAPVGADGLSAKLSSNENPNDPLPSVIDAIVKTFPTSVNRYPNMATPELSEALAARLGVDAQSLVFGSGSVEVASQLIHALAGPGDEVMYAWRSFEAYPILVRAAGAVPLEVPLDAELRHDLDAMADAITERTKLVFVCTPNNPTGATVTTNELDRFMQRVPKHVLVVIDEAYVHFDVDPKSPTGLDFFARYENVAVLHTFSKAYGLAGLRVGYAIARPDVAEALRKVALPFGVTDLAQSAAVASLAAEAELQVRIDTIVEERDRVYAALKSAGLPVFPSQANFVWLEAGESTEAVNEVFRARGVSVRAFAGSGLRISIGSAIENDAVIEVAGLAAAAHMNIQTNRGPQ
ncbi:histidinol-phosphate transaminase [Leucobacter denitrificans]|uniref:Aromatic amino acid aminotransferase n=1 Tax=Leucobacter denitrificans TaxID=683042 RepID=A0A7G9S341_9MICO|nr:histidinol-phosphate transaminase [Leucobacter denitrificans]QNN62266.1 histidinol-phosphate transaminase [Leucobacter denitrificans]